MAEKRLPTVKEVRSRIDGMPTDRRFGKIYQNALRYLYLTAGRPSEVSGKYAPIGDDAVRTEIDGIEAVIFPIKTARRRGKIRPVALPLPEKFEPWAEILYDWFKVYGDSPTFGGISMRSFQREAGEVFDGLMWPVEEYENVVYEKVDDSKIIYERTRDDGVKEYLVEFPDLERRWVEDPKVQVKIETIPKHWVPFTIQGLRQQRIRELKYFYRFTDDQIRIYTGLTSQDRNTRGYSTLDRYDWVNPSKDELQVEALRYAARSYFENLLKPRG